MALATTDNFVTYEADPNVIPIGSILQVDFQFLEDDDLSVVFSDIDGSNPLTWIFGQDYNLEGAGDPEGGNLETISIIPFGFKITIQRDADFTQLTVYPQDGKFPSASHERALDKLTMLCQQLLLLIDGGLRFELPVLLANPNLNLELSAPIANFFWAWDAAGEKVEFVPGPEVPQSVIEIQHFDIVTPTDTLTITEFTIDNTDEMQLFVLQTGGVQFRELLIDEFTLLNNVITLDDELQSGATADVYRISPLNKGGRQFHRDLLDTPRQVFDIFSFNDKNDISVHVDSIYQPPESYTRSGQAQITFDELIPTGIPVDVDERLGTKGEIGDTGPAGAGNGDVIGPAGGVVNNEIVLFDATTGKLIKGSLGALIDGSGNFTVIGNVQGRNIMADGVFLDTIQAGAQVNNISDSDANELTTGGFTLLHQHAGGDLTGPGVAVTNESVPVFNGITGVLVKESPVTIDVSGNIATPGTVDDRDLSVDGARLDLMEDSATADQTGAQIKVAYEAEVNTNSFEDAEKTKLGLLKNSVNTSFSGSEGLGAETLSGTYVVLGQIIYEGSTALGAITAIKAVISITGGATSGDIRIFDVSNANTIAELTGFTDTVPTIVDLGTVSNVPTGEALFELQLLRTGGGGGDRARCSNVQLRI